MFLNITPSAGSELFGENGPYPGWLKTKRIPVTFLKEYRNFILFRVEPHFSKSDYHIDESQPYNVTIDKDLFIKGHVLIER